VSEHSTRYLCSHVSREVLHVRAEHCEFVSLLFVALLSADWDQQEHGIDLGVFSRPLWGGEFVGGSQGQHWTSCQGDTFDWLVHFISCPVVGLYSESVEISFEYYEQTLLWQLPLPAGYCNMCDDDDI